MTGPTSMRTYEAPRIEERVAIDAPLVLTVASNNIDGNA